MAVAPAHPPPARPRLQTPAASGSGGTIPLGRLAGIPVGIQPLWLVIVALITWSLGADYFPSEAPGIDPAAAYALGLASALLLFAGILAHELGHAIVARRHGVRVEEIDLWLLGGVARLRDEPTDPKAELRFALAGPLVTVVLAAVFGAVRLAIGDGSPAWVRALVDYQLYVNAAILVLNMAPAFPLDGGRVLRALLWRGTGDQLRATRWAASAGRMFGWWFVVLGVLALVTGAPAGVWTIIIGGFLILAARGETEHVRMQQALAGRRVADVMSSPALVVSARSTVDEAVREAFARHLHRAFPVVDDGDDRVIGLLTLSAARAVPADSRGRVMVDAVADRDPDLLASPDDPLAAVVSRPAFVRTGRAVVLDADGGAAGVLSKSDVDRLLLALELAGHTPQEVNDV